MKRIIILLIVLINFIYVFAQDRIVYDDAKPESELSAAINPIDTNNIIIAVINGFSGNDNDFSSAFSIYYTLDFGETWQKSVFHGVLNGYAGAGDPILKFDNNGVAYLVGLSAKMTNDDPIIHTLISYSTDKGVTWNSIITNSGQTDKPWLAIDNNETSSYKNHKYVPTAIEKNNQMIIKLSVLDENNTVINDTTNVFGNKSVHLPCVDINSIGDVFVSAYCISDESIMIARSGNGGNNFDSHRQIAKVKLADNRVITGITSRLQCSPYMAIDKSGSIYKNRIYFTYTDYENGSVEGTNALLDTYLTWSDDNGETWKTPKVINATATQQTQQFYSNIYVNNRGNLLLAWYDGRNDTENKNIDYYLGISTDGGNTINEIKVSSAPSDFTKIGLKNDNFGIGDYMQVVATDNIAIPFWADGRTNDGDVNVYFAKVNINNPTGIQERSSISYNINMKIYPNIVENEVNIEVILKKSSKIRWDIIDINGRIVKYSEAETYTEGLNKITIPVFSLKQGVYFVKFELDNGFVKTKRIIKE